MHADVIILICLIRTVIDGLIEAERITAVELRVLIAVIPEDLFKDHLGDLVDDLGIIDLLFFNLPVDLLLLIRKENIDIPILLNEHLALQNY